MKPPRIRTIVIVAVAASFLTMFLQAGAGMRWFNTMLAAGGLVAIAGLLLLVIRLQERSDAKHAAANLARRRRIEADKRQRELWEARLG